MNIIQHSNNQLGLSLTGCCVLLSEATVGTSGGICSAPGQTLVPV